MRRGHRAPLVVGVLITTRRATALSVPGIFACGDVLFGQGSVLPPWSSEIVERVCRRAVSGHLNSRERTNQISACRRNSRDPVGAPGAAGQATLSLRLLGHRFARKGGHTRPTWRIVGFGIHAVNGAIFGLVFEATRRRTSIDSRRLAVGMALAEHVALFPHTYFVDRFHPARGESGVPPLLTDPRAFGQATWRHALFGAVLGRLA